MSTPAKKPQKKTAQAKASSKAKKPSKKDASKSKPKQLARQVPPQDEQTPTPPEEKKFGRPPTRPKPQERINAICERIIGGEGIVRICESHDMPHASAVYLAMANDEDFRIAITRAREAQQDAIIDSTVDLADTANPENVQVVKLQIATRQWRAAKLAAKKYGDKLEVKTDAKFISLTELSPKMADEPEDE